MHHSKKILIVEDDKDMADLLQNISSNIIEKAHFDSVVSLEEAFEKLIKNTHIAKISPYDLIIADVILEGKGTGLDFFHVINRIYPQIPFLIISAMPIDIIKKLSSEAQKKIIFLQKPFKIEDCKKIIRTITDPCFIQPQDGVTYI